jgi:hypothetical protein
MAGKYPNARELIYDYGNSKLEEMNTPNVFSGYGIIPRRTGCGMRSVMRGSGGAPIRSTSFRPLQTGIGMRMESMDDKVLPPQAATSVIQTGGPLIQMYSAANSPMYSGSPLLEKPIKTGGSFRPAGGRSGMGFNPAG